MCNTAELLELLLFMNYCIVVWAFKYLPLSMSKVVAQFILRVSGLSEGFYFLCVLEY